MMPSLLRKPFGLPVWIRQPFGIPFWLVLGIVLICLFTGMVIPIYAGVMGGQASRLAVLPALLLLLLLLIYDYRKLVLLIILLRSVGDKVLEGSGFGIGGIQMGIGGLINLAVIMIAAMLVLERPQHYSWKLTRIWLPLLAMLGISVVMSYEKGVAIKLFLGMLSSFAMFIIATYMVRSMDDFNRTVRLVVWSSLIPSLYAIVEIALYMRDGSFRLQSTFSHANVLGFYLTLIMTLCLYLLKSARVQLSPTARVILSGYMALLLLQLLLTQARSAWMASFFIFLSYALLFERKYLLYLLLLPLVAVLIPSVGDRLADLTQGNDAGRYARLNSFAWRLSLWQAAIEWMEPVRMIYGYGLDGFGHFSQTFFARAGERKWDAHSVYVQFLFDMGVLGVGAFLWLYGRALVLLRPLFRIERLTGFLMMAIVVQYVIVAFSDNLFGYLVFNWYFWFTIGGACSVAMLCAPPLPSAPPRYVPPSSY